MESAHTKRTKRNDAIASVIIKTVGVGTIFSIIAILFVIFKEFLPLLESTKIIDNIVIQDSNQGNSKTLIANMDVDFKKAYAINDKGRIQYYDIEKKEFIEEQKLPGSNDKSKIIDINRNINGKFTIIWNDNRITEDSVLFKTVHEKDKEPEVVYEYKQLQNWEWPSKDLISAQIRTHEEGASTLLTLNKQGELRGKIKFTIEDMFGEETEEELEFTIKPETASETIKQFTLDSQAEYAYALTKSNHLYRWKISLEEDDEEEEMVVKVTLLDKLIISDKASTPTTMTMLLSDQELAVAFSDGQSHIFSPSFSKQHQKRILKAIHKYKVCDKPIVQLIGSPRNRTIFALDSDHELHLYFSTNDRHLIDFKPKAKVQSMAISARGKGWLGILDNGQLEIFKLISNHPEANLKTLFQPVWYSGYEEPSFEWQSSGSNISEPKMSLTPLVFGTLKGAFYAMIFSVPISILAAMFISQFAGKTLKNIVKPIVEVMAAIPSVVVGFLAALWLAPIIHDNLIQAFLFIICLCMLIIVSLFVPMKKSKDFSSTGGLKLLLTTFITFLLFFSTIFIGNLIDNTFFDGKFQSWFITEHNELEYNIWFMSFFQNDYDIRNSVIISFALGFTVIPIIFTMSEDALSNVPRSLSTASLALGSTPWQTVWKVVLPAASPGIFAGIILGFGRAVGETMIVLMATGNTPIMDSSIFNGFRALSATIAVETPEAPHNGTLYRILFLSAALLLIFTSVLNTITEIIRQRLRKTYSKF